MADKSFCCFGPIGLAKKIRHAGSAETQVFNNGYKTGYRNGYKKGFKHGQSFMQTRLNANLEWYLGHKKIAKQTADNPAGGK